MNKFRPTKSNLASKWSEQIMGFGFTAVPNLLLMYRSQIGLTSTECVVLIAIDSFRWSEDNPWPSLNALSKRSGYSPRTLSRTITGLEEKGTVKRMKRRGSSNEYDLSPLVLWLEYLLEQDVPQGGDKVVYTARDMKSNYQRTSLSSKEYAANNTNLRKPFKKIVEAEILPVEPQPDDD